MTSTTGELLQEFYTALYRAYGPQHWWPGEGPTEIVIGAILTQNTNWQNVEKAIAQLRAARMIDWAALRDIEIERLAELIRPAGYYNVKAKRLKNFVGWLWERYEGDLTRLRDVPLEQLREELLSVNGIGRETADSILLYALDRPSFVVDAYTARLARRHRLIDEDADYERLKALFEDALPADVALFNEYHALIVAVGKRHCKSKAQCAGCPLEQFEHEVESC
ncbi:MAG TPA: endonuclease III domain-containing protein [Phycisphaerae bacterium]|nr:endonuclease III domain-containing protein [Phycisphaerae bacterium]